MKCIGKWAPIADKRYFANIWCFRVDSRKITMVFDVSEIIGLIADIGVIAGIIFLALELRQNNSLLAPR